MTSRRVLLVPLIVAGTFLIGVFAYAALVCTSARALINSASGIRSSADAEREIASWRKCLGCSFWENAATKDGDQTYDIHVDNAALTRLGIVRHTMLGVTIALRDHELRYVTAVMFAGKNPSPTAGVWIQEWFSRSGANDLRVGAKDRPWKATVEFPSAIPDAEREEAFALNAGCLVRLGGCRSAEDILPPIWRLGAK